MAELHEEHFEVIDRKIAENQRFIDAILKTQEKK